MLVVFLYPITFSLTGKTGRLIVMYYYIEYTYLIAQERSTFMREVNECLTNPRQ